jgi:uncharacterized protein YcfL
MKKLAIACTAVALMSLAACGGQPEAEANNVANVVAVDEIANDANVLEEAANVTAATNNAVAVEGNAAL